MIALYVAARDSRTPLLAKIVAGATAAYALSPLDLVPDFIPVLGLLDDLLIVPAGIWLTLRLIPGELMEEFRRTAARFAERPTSLAGTLVIVAAWLAAVAVAGLWFLGS